ncbi:MAG: agmatinase [Desulfobacteraceae bacterium]|nr:agmatinase [Desulfobacteraceae bacterium]
MTENNGMGSRAFGSLGPHCSFLGLQTEEADFDDAGAVIIPVPYDGTTTFRSGTREGPRAILNASRELELFDEETCTEVYREGLFTMPELPVNILSPRAMVQDVRDACEFVIGSGKFPVLLGGEHLLSLGMVEALAAKYPDLTILHLDAHSDLREEYQGSPYSNACIMRRAFDHARLVQVGIRSLTREEFDFIRERRIPCFFAYELHRKPALWESVPDAVGRGNVYISIDLDGFDPSIMPAVGTPEPGGLGWYETLAMLRTVIGQANIVGLDIMELLPVPPDTASEFFAARLLYKLLSYIFVDKGQVSC